MSATTIRDLVTRRAITDTPAALALARTITDSWYRTQALAWVARFAPEAEFKAIVLESLASCFVSDDPYRAVGAAAWSIRVLVEREHSKEVLGLLPKLLIRAADIANPVSRIDALFLLWQAVFPVGINLHRRVLEPLVAACREADSWKSPDTLRQVVLILASNSLLEAQQLVSSMPEGRRKRQVQREIADGQFQSPRTFFW